MNWNKSPLIDYYECLRKYCPNEWFIIIIALNCPRSMTRLYLFPWAHQIKARQLVPTPDQKTVTSGSVSSLIRILTLWWHVSDNNVLCNPSYHAIRSRNWNSGEVTKCSKQILIGVTKAMWKWMICVKFLLSDQFVDFSFCRVNFRTRSINVLLGTCATIILKLFKLQEEGQNFYHDTES